LFSALFEKETDNDVWKQIMSIIRTNVKRRLKKEAEAAESNKKKKKPEKWTYAEAHDEFMEQKIVNFSQIDPNFTKPLLSVVRKGKMLILMRDIYSLVMHVMVFTINFVKKMTIT
jgi:hypothetical protein